MSDNAENLLVIVLLATVVLRLVLVAIVVWLVIPRRCTCPLCSESTVPLVQAGYLRLLWLERRWCLHCGWIGLARKSRSGNSRTPTPVVSVR